MPPFGAEPAEKSTSSHDRFLHQRVRDPKRGTTPSKSTVFGPEPCESGRKVTNKNRCDVVKASALPFQDEGEESLGTTLKSKRPRVERVTAAPFQCEPEESQPSSSCIEMSSSDGDEADHYKPADTVFALGWMSTQRFTEGSFWKENSDEKKPAAKRAYDNSRRAAGAAYTRQSTQGAFKNNGTDPERLQTLFRSSSCHCSCVSIYYILS